ncbi:MAG: hypothetical protein VX320_06225 [Candidatus Thermoplasmatota archaeon]|nr:hypothetical protein [Candidatus Thermoplasmatota archaeon]
MSRLTLPILLSALLLASVIPYTSADVAPMSGGPVVISEDKTWDVDGILDAQVVVNAPATLTINADLTMANGSSITVNQGASLLLENGSLVADFGPHSVMPIPSSDIASLLVPASVFSQKFSLKIYAADGWSLDGWTVSWGGNAPYEINGTMEEIDFQSPMNDFRIYFNLFPGNYTTLVVDRLELVEDGNPTPHTVLAIDADPQDCFLAGTDILPNTHFFPLTIDGDANIVSSTIQGADVSITGTVTTEDATFLASGPLNVAGAGASLHMQGGSVKLPKYPYDHDVRMDVSADLNWGASMGSGGLIDRWERVIPEQTIHIPINGQGSGCPSTGCVQYTFHDLGPPTCKSCPNSGAAPYKIPNSNGDISVPSRTVEIGWADSTDVWTEEGFIEIVQFQTVWNFNMSIGSWSEGDMIPMPHDVEVFNIIEHLDYPIISVDDVALESDTAEVGKSIEVEITVSNSGTEAAIVATVCDLAGTGQNADMTPIFKVVTLAPGQTDSVDMRWSYGQSGSAGLVCSVIKPIQMLDSSIFLINSNKTASYGDSNEVEWGDSAQSEVDSMLIVGALIIVIIVCIGAVIRFAQQGAFSGEPTAEEIVEHLENEDDDERVDRFAEMMDEDDLED